MGFSETVQSSTASQNKSNVRFGSDFIRLNDEHKTIIRVLDEKPYMFKQHYVPEGHKAFPNVNRGKGMSITCSGWDTCPICAWNKTQLDKTNKLKLSTKYAFNVLDRTPVIICPKCNAEHYERVGASFPTDCHCGQSFNGIDPKPRNKIQIMQKGVKVMDQLVTFEKEYGALSGYDIKCDTRGKGKGAVTVCIPKPGTELDLSEWEPDKFNIEDSVKPLTAAQVNDILAGKNYFDVVSGK
jgi:hypothetical protein